MGSRRKIFINGVQVLNSFSFRLWFTGLWVWVGTNIEEVGCFAELMCLGALRCARVARMEVEANIPPLKHRRDALLLSHGIKTVWKPPLGNAASKIIWQHEHLHTAVHRPVSVRLYALCQQTGVRLDDADRLVLPTLPPWKKQETSINTTWIRGTKAVVAEEELH